MNPIIVWGFDEESKEYTHEVVCYPCPVMKTEYIYPNHYVPVKPIFGDHAVAVVNEDATGWRIEADYREEIFFDPEGEIHTITERGIIPDSSWTKDKPLSLLDRFELVRFALQAAIDEKAGEHGFSGGNALMLYANFDNDYRSLALPFAQWEASVWFQANVYKSQVLADAAPMVTPEEAVAMMPPLVLPAEQ